MSKKTFSPLKTIGLADLLSGLLERAEENLSIEDLESLRDGADDAAAAMTEDLASLMSALAVQVASDDDPDRSGAPAGAFLSGRSLSKLLFSLSNLAQQASAMQLVERMAANMIFVRRP